MPWYPPPAYASFVRLPDKLDVIQVDLNASVESGAYVSRLSAAAHAGAASLDPVSESDSSSSPESSDSSSRSSDVRVTRSSSSSSSTSSSSTNSNDMPPVANRPACRQEGGENEEEDKSEMQSDLFRHLLPLLLMQSLRCPLASCPPFIVLTQNIPYEKHLLRPTSAMVM